VGRNYSELALVVPRRPSVVQVYVCAQAFKSTEVLSSYFCRWPGFSTTIMIKHDQCAVEVLHFIASSDSGRQAHCSRADQCAVEGSYLHWSARATRFRDTGRHCFNLSRDFVRIRNRDRHPIATLDHHVIRATAKLRRSSATFSAKGVRHIFDSRRRKR